MVKDSRRHKNEMLMFYRHEFGAGITYATGGIEVQIDDVREIIDFEANIEQIVGDHGYAVTKDSITENKIKIIILDVEFKNVGAAWAELAPGTAINGWFLNVIYSGYQ